MNAGQVTNDKLLWLVIIHITFVASAMAMAYMDRMMGRH
jgi:uncharacterized protein (TIGR00645 family)